MSPNVVGSWVVCSTYANQELTKTFVARIVAVDGSEGELEELMIGAVELANQEEGTVVLSSVKTDDKTFWVFDAFVDEAGQPARNQFTSWCVRHGPTW